MPGELTTLSEPTSLRDDLALAFAEAEDDGQEGQESPSTELAVQERDATGKFAPRTPAQSVSEDPEPTEKEAPTTALTPTAAAPQDRAPITWKPQIREKWSGLDPDIKAEITRRERDIDLTLNKTAGDRRMVETLQGITAPYQHMLQAEGVDAVTAIQSFFRVAAQLRTAPMQQKVAIISDMINQHGIDLNMLDESLTSRMNGTAPTHSGMTPDIQAMIQQQLAPILGQFQQHQNTQQQALVQEAEQSWTQFSADPKNEFAHDVKDIMADLLDAAANRGVQLSLQDAYTRATLAHPQIADIIMQRQQVQQAAQQTNAARRAKKAAASVPNSGAPLQDGEDDDRDDLRSAVLASVKSLSR